MSRLGTKPTILIVDDSYVNRVLLKKIFSDEYHVEQAENGIQALELLRKLPDVAVVVLDILMPELDGYGVLSAMREDPRLKDIPVVVDTGNDDVENQLKALDYGAIDVLIKPFNPQIALHRIRNIILRREADKQAEHSRMLEQLLRQAEIDEKTGIYNKHAFCRRTSELLCANPDREYVLLRWDVDRFKVFNDIFGVAAGDEFLARIGEEYRKTVHSGMSYGHWEADHFVSCMPKDQFESEHVGELIAQFVSKFHADFEFVVRLGVYEVGDPKLDVALMCDRALLALRSIKNSYGTRVAYYDESMRAALMDEQEIINEMDRALEQGQFVVYLQPQYNYATNTLHGAEALVRWKHPEKGLIPPVKFIGIFERNGFICKVDEYVWEQVCQQQRKWLDAGIPVVPVSVNISRYDIYNPHLCGIIEGLVRKYSLSPSLLRLEITESAYMENAEQLIRTVKTLQAAGFSVEMDDFGSGYSSLNTLKTVPVDKLKLDMKFLEVSPEDTRGGSILTSVIRMANWIKLPVIAEGVETLEQAEYLKSVGCLHMQGYYFARPMPIPDFETLLNARPLQGESEGPVAKVPRNSINFLSSASQDTLLFNSFVGGAAIIEYDGCDVEALRLNDKFFEVLGTTREAYAGKQLHMLDRFDNKNRNLFLAAVHEAISTGDESSREICSLPLNEQDGWIWTRARMRLLDRNGSRYLLYLAVENITELIRLTEHLTTVMDSVPGGILDFEVTDDISIVYFNDIAATMFGYSRDEYERLYARTPLAVAHPEDLPSLRLKVSEVLQGKEQVLDASYRHRCADDGWRWVHLSGRVVRRGCDRIFASGILMDIDDQVSKEQVAKAQAEDLERQRLSVQVLYDTIPCGIMQFSVAADGKDTARLIGFNDTAWKIYRYESRMQYVEAVHDTCKLKDVYPDDLPIIRECISTVCQTEPGKRIDCDHRIICHDGSVRWVRALFQKMRYSSGEETIQAVFTDITERKQEDSRQLSNALFGVYDEVFEFDMEQDVCVMRSAKRSDDPRIGRFGSFHKHLETLCEKYAVVDDRQRIREFYDSIGHKTDRVPETLEYRYVSVTGEERWAMSTVLYLSGSSYLTCNRDITDQKNAQSLIKENEILQALIKERKKEDEQNRIFIESTGILVYDYDLASDTLKIQRKDTEQGVVEETTEHYVATIAENPAISVGDRKRMRDIFHEASKASGCWTTEYRSNRFNGEFGLCHAQIASIADKAGNVYRIIGQVSQISESLRQELSAQLVEITGSDYGDLAYEHSIVDEVIRILEFASDFRSAVQKVLAVVGRQFSVSRAYIIEEQGDGIHCSNTFEWCDTGIVPEIGNLQDYEYPEGMRNKYIEMFDQNGILACSDISAMTEWMRGVLAPQGIKAIVQCAIMDAGVFRGYVGFDECRETRNWTIRQIHTLQVVAKLLGAFLFANRSKQEFCLTAELERTIGESPAYVYIVDPDTYEVLYGNDSVIGVTGKPMVGDTCYRAFMNQDAMCDVCPIKLLHSNSFPVPMKISRDGRNFIMQASPFLWRGKKVILISGTDSSSFLEDPENARHEEYLQDLERYNRTLFGLYDEIFEFDYYNGTFLLLSSKYPDACASGVPEELQTAIEKWSAHFVKDEDRKALADFLDLRNIRDVFLKHDVPILEYMFLSPDGSRHSCRSTLLQMDSWRYLCCNKDVTEQKQAEELQKKILLLQTQTEAQDRYRIVVEQTGMAVIEMNHETGEFSYSEAYGKYETSRRSQEAMMSNSGDRQLVYPDDQVELQRFFDAKNRGASHAEAVLRIKMTDGSYRWTRMAGTYIRDGRGKLLRTIGTFLDVDEEVRSKKALEQLSERMHRIIANIPTGVAIYEIGEHILPIFASEKTCAMFGFTKEEYDLRIANGKPINFMPTSDSLPPDGLNKMMSGQPLVVQKLHVQRKDGSWFWLRAFCSIGKSQSDTPLCYAVLADISDEVAMEQKFMWQMEKYKILSESVDIITFDYSPQDDVMRVSLLLPNKGFTEEVRSHYLKTIDTYERISSACRGKLAAVLRSALRTGQNGTYDFEGDYYQTGMRWYRAKYVSLSDESGRCYRVIGRLDDINDIIIKQNQLRMAAQLDEVSGIYNKNYAIFAIATALREKKTDSVDAVLFLDIDNFKAINDTFGHLEADGILRQIGIILQGMFRKDDIVARFGGDEFIVYMRSAGDVETVTAKAKAIILAIHEIAMGEARSVCCSIGITNVVGEGISYNEVLKRADMALYEAKKNGKNQYAVLDWRV